LTIFIAASLTTEVFPQVFNNGKSCCDLGKHLQLYEQFKGVVISLRYWLFEKMSV